MARIRLFVIAIACLLAAGEAFADFRTLQLVEKSYELVLDNVTLPGSTAGTVIFKECDTCDVRAIGVNAATQYFLGSKQLALADLQQEVDSIKASGTADDVGVYIYCDINTGAVKRIRLVQFAPVP